MRCIHAALVTPRCLVSLTSATDCTHCVRAACEMHDAACLRTQLPARYTNTHASPEPGWEFCRGKIERLERRIMTQEPHRSGCRPAKGARQNHMRIECRDENIFRCSRESTARTFGARTLWGQNESDRRALRQCSMVLFLTVCACLTDDGSFPLSHEGPWFGPAARGTFPRCLTGTPHQS